ncbi:MAG: FG-GAP-like repeat-containing protein [Planctomycetota bacterium]|nr:FG-GAP-like repeat-containing protein [Planctomycetota bacterium]
MRVANVRWFVAGMLTLGLLVHISCGGGGGGGKGGGGPLYGLGINTPLGNGNVTASPVGSPPFFYPPNTLVTLTAAPLPGFMLISWSGTDDDTSTALTNTVTMDSDPKQVDVVFDYELFTLTILTDGTGSGTVTPDIPGPYPSGTFVRPTATADPGSRIIAWAGTEAIADVAPEQLVIVLVDQTITVTFELIPSYTLTVNTGGGTGGTVALNPPTGPYLERTKVMLTASPNPGERVASWAGTDVEMSTATAGRDLPLTNTVTMTSDRTVTATFETTPAQSMLTVTPGANGTIHPPSGLVDTGATVPLTALPDAGYEVTLWSGTDDDASTNPQNSVTVAGATTVSATFALTTYTQRTFDVSSLVYTSGSIRVIDYDDDGDLDLIVNQVDATNWIPQPLLAFNNDGTGGFTEDTNAFGGGTVDLIDAFKGIAADFTGDGLVDFFIGDGGPDTATNPGGQDRLLVQNASGQLIDETAARLPAILAFTHDMAFGDIDGDLDLDIFVANISSLSGEASRFLINDGAGNFTDDQTRGPAYIFDLMNVNYTGCGLVDVDDDGDLDLLLGLFSPPNVPPGDPFDRILLNDGTGNFTPAPIRTLPPRQANENYATAEIDGADLDGDGWNDLIVIANGPAGGTPSPRLQVLINDRDGSFRDETALMPQPWIALNGLLLSAAQTADVNLDGIPDIQAIPDGVGSTMFRVFETRRVPTLTFVEVFSFPGIPAIGDFDGDGDIDFVQIPQVATPSLATVYLRD